MARRHGRGSSPSRSAPTSGAIPRDTRRIATGLAKQPLRRVALSPSPVPGFVSSAVRSQRLLFEDRRRLPDDAPARSTRRVARIGLVPARKASSGRTWSALHFSYPEHALVCVRRKSRRQVLFALGRGGGGKRRPRRNDYSDVRC